MKRAFMMVLLFFVMVGAFCITANAAITDTGTCGDNLTWTLEEGELTVSGTGAMNSDPSWRDYASQIKVVEIKDGVTSIGDYAFCDCTSLSSITFPDSVTTIGYMAFYHCDNLTSITIPDSVTSIGDFAFCECADMQNVYISDLSAWCRIEFNNKYSTPMCYADNLYLNDVLLTDVTVPNSVTSIGAYAFSNCSKLTDVTIGNGVTSIGDFAFDNCENLTNLTIGSGVTSIGGWAFNCENLTNLTIRVGSGVPHIDNDAFVNCNSLTNVYIVDYYAWLESGWSDAIPRIGKNLSMHTVDMDGNEITELVLDSPVTEIPENAFANFKNLTSVVISDSVTSIGNNAFDRCYKLTNVTIGNSVTSIGDSAFYSCNNLTRINIPDSVTTIGNNAFYNCYYLISITIPDSVTGIGDYAFYNCTDLTDVTIGNGVTSIGDYAFYNCTDLTDVTIGNSVTSIGDYAFYNCTKLTRINIPDSVTTIGRYAFLSSVVIITSKSVTAATQYAEINGNLIAYREDADESGKVGKYTWTLNKASGVLSFTGSGNMPHFTVSETPPWYDYKGYITAVVLPDTMTRVGSYAFYDLTKVKNVHIPDSVTTIGSHAFSRCSGLKDVTIGNGVTSIGDYAFYYCENLTNLTIGSGVTSIGNYAFYVSDNLTNLTIRVGSGVPHIGNYAFSNDTRLINVYIVDYYAWLESGWLDAISRIGKNLNMHTVDMDGNEITELVLDSPVTEIPKNAFANFRNLTSVVISDSVTSIGNNAFYNCVKLMRVNIPDSVTTIGYNAFYNCNDLISITIPDSVTGIGGDAFSSCDTLETVVVYSKNCNFGINCGITYNSTIYGYKGSTAEALADNLGAEFFALEEGCPPGDDGQVQHRWIDATCTAPKTCSACGATEGGAPGHTEATVSGFAASCTEPGLTDGVKCSVCGDTLVVQTAIPATGHSYSYTATKDPTTSAIGILTGTCSKCQGTTTVTLPKLNTIDYTYAVETVATCISDGMCTYAWKTTTYGNFSFNVTLTKIAHDYSNGTCRYCGADDPNDTDVGLIGDISGDGRVNMGDVAKLYAHIKGTSILTDETGLDRCDISGDGKVNMGDVAKLYAHIKGTNKLY